MRILLVTAVLALVPLTSTPALAGPQPDVKKMTTDDCARARKQNKTCVINIEGMDVDGQNPTGTGERITTPDFGRSASLIRIRRDFIQEILKSAEDLP